MAMLDVYKLTVIGLITGQETQNVFHYQVTALPGVDSPTDLGSEFETSVMPTWKAAVSVQWEHTITRVQKVYPALEVFSEIAPTPPTLGLILGDALPNMDAVVLTKRTFTPGAKGRGRAYIAGVAEGDQSGGLLTAAALTRFESLAEELDQVMATISASYSPVVFSSSPVPPEVPPVARLITDMQAQSILGTQRRRRIGRGV